MVKPVWNNAQRVNHQNFAKKTHPCAKKNLVPRAVLMKSGLVSVNTARQVNTAHSKTTVNAARPMPKAVVNAVKGNSFNAVKASACWVWKPKTKVLDHGNPQIDLQDQRVIDSGCSRHMTGNMSYLTNYEEIDGGYVAFGGNPKGGKITGKCTIKTGNLDFENALSHTSIGMDVLPCNCYIMGSNTVSIIGSNTCFHAVTSRGKEFLYDTISIKEVLAGNGVNL
ncbi:hypothetical protein Tco_0701954 [Tanacetum coccineum]|uniref:Retrovirus-related Pol polyprotein from transposon TNT 1-94-like beta-barrel domain-containing protein n=1 Tax=Tanacetum coccineum TaxID=301880 RepID=A0ABQ4XW52_9ASTR